MIIKETLRHPLIRGIIIFLTICALGLYLLCYGCANHMARYTGIDSTGKPYTIELRASRFAMGQEVQGFSAVFPEGYKIGFDSSKGDPTKVMENFFGVLGPILQAYVSSQPRLPQGGTLK